MTSKDTGPSLKLWDPHNEEKQRKESEFAVAQSMSIADWGEFYGFEVIKDFSYDTDTGKHEVGKAADGSPITMDTPSVILALVERSVVASLGEESMARIANTGTDYVREFFSNADNTSRESGFRG